VRRGLQETEVKVNCVASVAVLPVLMKMEHKQSAYTLIEVEDVRLSMETETMRNKDRFLGLFVSRVTNSKLHINKPYVKKT
jgi:hypothetical protein